MKKPIPGCQYEDCFYRMSGHGACNYFDIEGQTRTAIHRGENVDINNPCQEYKPIPKSRYTMRINNRR